jgi:hypothetical protein
MCLPLIDRSNSWHKCWREKRAAFSAKQVPRQEKPLHHHLLSRIPSQPPPRTSGSISCYAIWWLPLTASLTLHQRQLLLWAQQACLGAASTVLEAGHRAMIFLPHLLVASLLI